jgi:hypothetical protein
LLPEQEGAPMFSADLNTCERDSRPAVGDLSVCACADDAAGPAQQFLAPALVAAYGRSA